MKKKILSVFGTRPEAIKMSLLVKRLSENGAFSSFVCVTGQHREMLDQVLTAFNVIPDYDLDLMKSGQNLHDLFAAVISGLRPILLEVKPDIVLIHGDTLTCFAAATAAFFEQIPVGHVEAGLRSHNLMAPWPEEANRRVASILTSLHFAPTEGSKQNLLKEGIPEKQIVVTGNTVIDSLLWMRDRILTDSGLNMELSDRFPFLKEEKRLVLVTGHRRENFGRGMEDICEAIRQVAQSTEDVQVVYPVHLNPNVKEPVTRLLSDLGNVHLIEPLEYEPFVYLMDRSYFILTDSGGIQEEAPSLGKPVLVMRETTERPEAVEAGTVKLVGTEVKEIVTHCRVLLEDDALYTAMGKTHNPYGDGKAIFRIIEALNG